MNKYIVVVLLLFLTVFNNLISAKEINQTIDAGWKFRQSRLTNWYPATVPGNIHSDLTAAGMIKNPYENVNLRGGQWVEREDWVYETTFDVKDGIFEKENIYLIFKGLDTYADVMLNDIEILKADNMFREWRINVTDILQENNNTLRVYFHSPVKKDIEKWNTLPYKYQLEDDNTDGIDKRTGIFTRKPAYHYNNKCGFNLITSGIWQSIILQAYDDVTEISNIYVRQGEIVKKQITVSIDADIYTGEDMYGAAVNVYDNNTGTLYGTAVVDLPQGNNSTTVSFIIKNPQQWWCNGMGVPYLYDFRIELSYQNEIKVADTISAGIRTLKLINNADSGGSDFYFELNGVPVFSKGALYMPCDVFLTRVTDAMIEKIVLDAVAANMNMLRVWGGGVYERDYFYELCDRHGIMVWQDFMFTPNYYPVDSELEENLRQEAVLHIKRLRNHPSLALWYAGKENYKNKNISDDRKNICTQLFPDLLKEYHPDVSYHSSVSFGEADSLVCGLEKVPFLYNDILPSYPEYKSLRQYAASNLNEREINGENINIFQCENTSGSDVFQKYLFQNYPEPEDFQAFVYMNQIAQSKLLTEDIEARRRNMSKTRGFILQQYNDYLPAFSTSVRDYYGRPKAAFYALKNHFDDVLVSIVDNDTKLDVYVISEKQYAVKGQLDVTVLKLDGTIVNRLKKPVTLNPNGSNLLFSEPIDVLLKGLSKHDVLILATFYENRKNNDKTYKNTHFLLSPRDINYPVPYISYEINSQYDEYEVTLKSDCFAHGVFLSLDSADCSFDDNYFDLLPNTEKTVIAKANLSKEDFEQKLKVVSFRDMYH